jgi:iron complex transport system substrate-binding protein
MTIADAGPPEVIAQIEGAGIPVFVVPTEDSVAGAKNAISTIGRIVSRVEQAQALIQEIDADVAGARSYVDRVTAAGDAEQRSATFVYARGAGTLMVSGISTSADAMIELAGARNAVTGYRGYKPLTPEALVAAAPEVLIFTNSGLRSIGGVEGAREIPGVDQTPAGRHGRFIAMDDLYLLGFGPRLGEAVRDLSQRIYPEGEGL